MTFVDAMTADSKRTVTENGMPALNTTDSAVLDLFANIGAMRGNSPVEVEQKVIKSFHENPALTIKMAFYVRDARQGLGERKNGNAMLRWLANKCPDIMKKNVALVPEYGRWDDMYSFVGTPCEDTMWNTVKAQLAQDMADAKVGKPISLCAKWLKSAEKCSAKTNAMGRVTMYKLGLDKRRYRKMLSGLRKHIDVVERRMCAKDWTGINYEAVPSYAMKNYRKAFRSHDTERFDEYIGKLAKGEAKVNASTLYPYNIIESYGGFYPHAQDDILEAQWKALPNYVDGENNVLVMADTSGSMSGRPIAAAVGLAIYFAQRNKGPFHNVFMSFSNRPDFITLNDKATLRENLVTSVRASWAMNTNIDAAMRKILNVCVENNLPQSEVPKALVIVSDLQFDYCASTRNADTYFGRIRKMFADAGYTAPNIVFWNATEVSRSTHHATATDKYVQMFSGYSASIFKSVIDAIDMTPYEAMLNTLNNERYAAIATE